MVRRDVRKYSKEWKEVLMLKHFIRVALSGEVLIVQGMPGAKKTLYTISATKDLYREGAVEKVLVAEPQRYLRDYVANEWVKSAHVVKARDELCEKVRIATANEKENYLVKAFEVCKSCPYFRTVQCTFYRQFKELRKIKSGFVVTTHRLAPIVTWIWRPNIIVFDEAEDYLQFLAQPIDPLALEELRKLDEKIWKRIMAELYQDKKGKYYLKPTWFSIVSSKTVLVSATFPDELEKQIVEDFMKLKDGEPLYYIPRYTIPAENHDYLLVLDDVQVYRKSAKLEEQDWWKKIVPRLIDMVNVAVEKKGVVGVVSKNKEMTRKLHDLFISLGYEVTSDAVDEKPYPDAVIWIITVRGKWYRGVSLRPRKARDRRDFPVILAFYQAQDPRKKLNKVPPWLWDWEVNKFEILTLCQDLIRAENLQTLFRFNRERDKRHLVVAFDRRMYYALEKMLDSYIRHLDHKEIVKDLNELVKRYIELIDKL